MTLTPYRQKRTLSATPEPAPLQGGKAGHYLAFVVQKHAATRLHYDLRLEMGGVLRSFAVPKGPSLDPSAKRLAVLVEDHPFAYKDFEGYIPDGNYGAGGVIIWDRGFYGHPAATTRKDAERLLAEGFRKGDLKFMLAGQKLKGKFALVKTGWDSKSWLLIKKKDPYATSADVLDNDRSVVSGKTVAEISPSSGPSEHGAEVDSGNRRAKLVAMPHHIRPMLAISGSKPFNHPEWLFEIKWDGYRAIAETGKGGAKLYSRNQTPLSRAFPPVVDSLKRLECEAVLDGEVVAVNAQGVPDFQMLQEYKKSGKGRLLYYVFDILHYQGRDVTGLPLVKRKELLKKIIPNSEHVKVSDHVWNDGVSFFRAARKKGLEGIMAKHSKSRYHEGVRSRKWLKIKNRLEQDCVIAGFTTPRGARKYVGSLVLGAFEKGKLVYVGHSGGGFGNEDLESAFEKLRPLVTDACPFTTLPPESDGVTWVRPVLVATFHFTEWTKDRIMRHPVLVRFREDKAVQEAVREIPRISARKEPTT